MAPKDPNFTPTAKSYTWKDGAAEFRKHDPAAIHAELDRIREKHGGELRASIVVDEAKSKRSPLHEIIFSLSDEEAARLGREHIAGRLIRSIEVKIVTAERKEIVVRAFTSRPVPNSGGLRTYASTAETMSTEEGRAVLLRQAWLELRAFKRKYEGLSELAKVLDAVEEVLSSRKAG